MSILFPLDKIFIKRLYHLGGLLIKNEEVIEFVSFCGQDNSWTS